MTKTIKFSELPPGQFIAYSDDVISQQKALEIHKAGAKEPMYTIIQEFVDSILHQVFEDAVNGINKELYTAPNDGLLIVFEEDTE
ncbi:hypothetical protein EMERY_88 [Brevibacillus phage Emery]|nr:hypothetical protein EMERY_88 [Brevibacillus phage Emery]